MEGTTDSTGDVLTVPVYMPPWPGLPGRTRGRMSGYFIIALPAVLPLSYL